MSLGVLYRSLSPCITLHITRTRGDDPFWDFRWNIPQIDKNLVTRQAQPLSPLVVDASSPLMERVGSDLLKDLCSVSQLLVNPDVHSL